MSRRAAFLAVILAALAAPAYADVTSEGLLRQFVEAMDGGDWSATSATIRSEGADTIAEAVVVSRRDPDISVSVEVLRVRDLAEDRDGGGFSASEIEVTGAAVTSETMELAIPSAVAADVSMPSFAGLSIDTSRLMTSMARFYSTAAEGEVGELTIPQASGVARQTMPGESEPVESTFSYGNIRLAGFRDGVIELQELGPFSMSGPAGPGQEDVLFTIERMAGEGIDLAAAARILDETQYQGGRGDGVWRPIVSRIVYGGFSATGPEGFTFALEEAAIENIEGRQPEAPFTGDFDRLLDPATTGAMEPDVIMEALTNMYSAWRLGTLRLDGLSFDAPAQASAFSLGNLTLTGLSTDGLDGFIMQGLSGRGPGGFASLDSFELAGLVFPDLDALTAFAALESDVNSKKHEETIRAAFAALPRLSHLGLTNLAGGESEAAAVKLAGFTLDFADWNEIFAQSTDVQLEGLEVPRALMQLDPQASEMMDKLGYERFVFGMSISDRWSPEDGSDDGVWTFSMQDAANIELAYSLTGVTIDWMIETTAEAARAADPTAAYMVMLAELGLESATLKMTDRSLLDRGFGVAAAMQGLSVDGAAYREQMRGALPFLLSAAVPADLARLLTEPLRAFLGGGQTLVAEISPATPIPLVNLLGMSSVDPMELPELLGMTVRSEKAAE